MDFISHFAHPGRGRCWSPRLRNRVVELMEAGHGPKHISWTPPHVQHKEANDEDSLRHVWLAGARPSRAVKTHKTRKHHLTHNTNTDTFHCPTGIGRVISSTNLNPLDTWAWNAIKRETVVTTLTPEAARVWAAVRACQLRVRLLRGWEERRMMTTSTHRKWYFPKNYHNFDVSGGYFEHVGPLTTFQHHLIQHFASGFGQARTLSTFRYLILCKRKGPKF